MAKYEGVLRGPFFEVLTTVDDAVMHGSISATLEDRSDFHVDDVACAVRVYERYSYLGRNRVSMSITFLGPVGGPVHISAITSGGSQAMFFKINTFGEQAFLDTLTRVLEQYRDPGAHL